jgi:nucleotide-binding universal stress UspA family protein
VLEMASGLGAALGGAAELHILFVLSGAPTTSAMGMAPLVPAVALRDEGRMILDNACRDAASRFRGKIFGHLAAGDPAREITQVAATLHADLVVVGTAGRKGLARLALGSVAENVVRSAGCPVLVARPKDFPEQEHATPEIEPACPDCVMTQKQTARAQLWCARHSTHHAHGHLHYEVPPSFAMGTMLLRPE